MKKEIGASGHTSLSSRGAAIESVAPQTKDLSETAFYAFAEQVFDCRIDHRSFERQGVEQIPTQHEDPATFL